MSPPRPSPERRDAIKRVATDLFAGQGYHAVGMRSIAEAVGVQASTLYHHFPSKQALLEAIAEEATHAFVEGHLPRLLGDGPAAVRLEATLREHIAYFWEHRRSQAVGLREIRELEAESPEAYERIRRDRLRYQHAIAAVVAEGRAQGVFAVRDPDLAAIALLTVVNGVNDWFKPDGRLSLAEVADGVVRDLVLDGMLGLGR